MEERKKEIELEWVELHKGYNFIFSSWKSLEEFWAWREWSGGGIAKEIGSWFLWWILEGIHFEVDYSIWFVTLFVVCNWYLKEEDWWKAWIFLFHMTLFVDSVVVNILVWVQIHQSSCVVMRRLIMGSILVARLPAAAVMLLLLLVVVAHAERHPLEVKFDHMQPLSRIGLHRQLTAISPSVKISASPEVLGADVSQEEEEAPLSLPPPPPPPWIFLFGNNSSSSSSICLNPKTPKTGANFSLWLKIIATHKVDWVVPWTRHRMAHIFRSWIFCTGKYICLCDSHFQ